MVSDLINYDDFTKIQFCAGTIIAAKPNEKAIRPAYLLTIDFGEHGIKTSSAQITEHYECDELIGQQIVAVMNFPAKRVAGVKSEVLVLAAVCKSNGTILLQPNKPVIDGCRVA